MKSEKAEFTVFGFAGTHDALRAEDVLLEAAVDVVLIPTPRALGSLCGFAVRVPSPERIAAIEALHAAMLSPDGEIKVMDRI